MKRKFCDKNEGNHVRARLFRMAENIQHYFVAFEYTVKKNGEYKEIWGINSLGQKAKIYPFRFI